MTGQLQWIKRDLTWWVKLLTISCSASVKAGTCTTGTCGALPNLPVPLICSVLCEVALIVRVEWTSINKTYSNANNRQKGYSMASNNRIIIVQSSPLIKAPCSIAFHWRDYPFLIVDASNTLFSPLNKDLLYKHHSLPALGGSLLGEPLAEPSLGYTSHL